MTITTIALTAAMAFSLLFMLAGRDTPHSIMVGVNGRYVEIAHGDTAELAVPSEQKLSRYFSVKCPPSYAPGCAVQLFDPPVEATFGTTCLKGRTVAGTGRTMFRFTVWVTVVAKGK